MVHLPALQHPSLLETAAVLPQLAPDFRIPFGHKHAGQEEVYVVLSGSARIKVEDEIVELDAWDAIRFDKDTMRDVQAGPGRRRVPGLRCRRRPRRRRDGPGWWSD